MKKKLLYYALVFTFFSIYCFHSSFGQGSGSAIRFTADGQYVNSDASGQFNTQFSSTERTVECWVKFERDPLANNAWLVDLANSDQTSGAVTGGNAGTGAIALANTPLFLSWSYLYWNGASLIDPTADNSFVIGFRSNADPANFYGGDRDAFSGDFIDFSFPFTPQQNTWYHVVGTLSIAGGNTTGRLFVNGIQLTTGNAFRTPRTFISSGNYTSGVVTNIGNTFPLTATGIVPRRIKDGATYLNPGDVGIRAFIGRRPQGNFAVAGDAQLIGQIDEVRIWNKPINQTTELQPFMCSKRTADPGFFIINYGFDEAAGNAIDNIGTNAAGYLTGASRILSGAPIGDASDFVYSGTTTNIGYSTGNFQVTATANTPVLQVYRVNVSPNNTTVPAQMGNIDTQYFGVFTGTDNITYSAAYNHAGTAILPDPPNPSTAPLALAVARRLRNDAGAFAYDATGVAAATTHTVTGLTTNLAVAIPINQQEFIYGAVPVPVLAAIEAGAITYTENDPATQITASLTVTGTVITSATARITANYQNGQDLLEFTNGTYGGVAFIGSFDAGTGTLTITPNVAGTGTPASMQAALIAVNYRNSSEVPSILARQVTFTAFNGGLASNTQIRTINVTPVNDPPVISGTTSPLTYVKLAPAISVATPIAITDPDDSFLSAASVIITNFIPGEDEFQFTLPLPAGIIEGAGELNGMGIAQVATINFTGLATLAAYRGLLASLTYRNISAAPDPATRTVAFQVTDSGSGDNILVFLSNLVNPQVVINIDATFNVAPTLDAGCVTTRTFTEGNVSTLLLAAGLDVNDVESPPNNNLSKAEFKITGGYQNGQDELFYDGALPATVMAFSNWNAATGVYTLIGTDLITQYETFAQNVKFRNTNINNPAGGNRTITVQFFDNGFPDATPTNVKGTNICSITLNVVPINTVPNLSAPTCANSTFTEGGTAVPILTAITIADLDNTSLGTATIRITNAQAGDLLSYNPIAGNPVSSGTYTVIGAIGSLVLGVNGATHAQLATALANMRFSNTSQNPSNVIRTIEFLVNDGSPIAPANLISNIVPCQVNLTPVNNPPVLAAVEIPNLAYTEFEAAKQITNTITVNDVDNTTLVSATISISGGFAEDVLAYTVIAGNPIISGGFGGGVLTLNGMATLLQYQAALRNVTYSNTSRNPDTSVRTVSFVVNDGSAVAPINLNSVAVTRQINITPVNDAPVVANTSPTQTYTENEAPKSIFLTPANFTVTDVDNANLASATVQITGAYAANQDVLALGNAGLGIIGTWNVASGTLTLSGAATIANYEIAIRSVTYSNSSENPSGLQRTMSISVNDGLLSSNIAIQLVNVIPVNDAPVVSNFTRRTGVNIALPLNNDVFLQSYSDVESDVMQSISIATLPSNGTLTQNGVPVVVSQVITSASIALVYTPNRNYQGNDSFEWRASDGALFSVAAARADIVVGATGIYPPINLKAKAGSQQVFLTWEPVVVAGVNVSYEIYVFSANQAQKLVGTTDQEKFTVTGLENAVTYVFRVLAIDALGRTSDFSNPATARPSIILGAEEADLANLNFALYPNPNTGNFVLLFEEKASKNANIQIFNTLGQKVFGKEIQSVSGRYEEKIDSVILAEGTYILYISTGTNNYQKRFVVQK